MATDRRHALLVNPAAGHGRGGKRLLEAERELAARGIDFHTIPTRSLEHGVEEALAAARSNEVPVVMGGDGLIGAVGGALAGSATPLAVIPGGRGNDFARVLGIPADIPEAVSVIAAGKERRIDVGSANGKRFLCIASCGFDSDANRRANEARLIRGPLVYVYAALRTLATWRPATFTVTIDGERREFTGFSTAVANGSAYGGGMMMAPDAELDDGRFDVVMSSTVSKRRFLANLPKVFKGEHVEEEEVTVARGSEVEITADREFELYADGESLTTLPAKLRVLHLALRVIAPAT